MKKTIILISMVSFISLFISRRGISQEEFIQFTYYDQIKWSPDGEHLAFRCILLDESRPDIAHANLMLADISKNQLICLDPEPESFIVSSDKKRILFSSIYGLYLMNLNKRGPAVQIYFREPAAPWRFSDFGFTEDHEKIYMNRFYTSERKSTEEYILLKSVPRSEVSVTAATVEKFNQKSELRPANLNMETFASKKDKEIDFKESVLKISPIEGSPGEYNVILQSGGNKVNPRVLLEKSRIRILSQNPDNTSAILSVLHEKKFKTYQFDSKASNLKKIIDEHMYSISWLNATEYICATENGLFLRNINSNRNEKLNEFVHPEWCQSIEMKLPNYELQVGFEYDKSKANEVLSKLSDMGFDGRLLFHQTRLQIGYRIRVGGFPTKKEAQSAGEKLQDHGYKFWVDNIPDIFDFFNRNWNDESKAFHGRQAAIQYRMNDFLRTRIVLLEENKEQIILVDEMNNIPDRTEWK